MFNPIGFAGIAVILGIAFLFSSNRRGISLRVVGAAFLLQAAIAIFVLYFDAGRGVIDTLSTGVLAVIGYSRAGIDMVFGPLADVDKIGFSFAINILPIIIFFSALMSVMYHLRIMEWVVKLVGGALHKIIGTGAVESMNAAANVFVGQTEAPLAIKPYLKDLTEPQMFAVMVSGLASIAGTVLAGYVLMGAELKYLLAAAFMAAPGGLLMAKILMPDEHAVPPGGHEKLVMEPSHHKNVILAAASGTTDGLRLAANIGAMLIAFVALIALFNGLVGGLFGLFGIERNHAAVHTGEDFPTIDVFAQCALGRSASRGCFVRRKADSQRVCGVFTLERVSGGNESSYLCNLHIHAVRVCEPLVDRDPVGWSRCPGARKTRPDWTIRHESGPGRFAVQSHECRTGRTDTDVLASLSRAALQF